MPLHVGDEVIVMDKSRSKELAYGRVIDLKWNLALVRLRSGEQDWYNIKSLKNYVHPTTS